MGQIKNIKLHIVTDIKGEKKIQCTMKSRQVVRSLIRLASVQSRVISSRATPFTNVGSTISHRFTPVALNTIPQRYYSDDIDEAALVETLGLDSLQVANIQMALEEDLSITFSDEDFETVKTVQEVIDKVKQKLEE